MVFKIEKHFFYTQTNASEATAFSKVWTRKQLNLSFLYFATLSNYFMGIIYFMKH